MGFFDDIGRSFQDFGNTINNEVIKPAETTINNELYKPAIITLDPNKNGFTNTFDPNKGILK